MVRDRPANKAYKIAIAQSGSVPLVYFLLIPERAAGLPGALLGYRRLLLGAHLCSPLAKQEATRCIAW